MTSFFSTSLSESYDNSLWSIYLNHYIYFPTTPTRRVQPRGCTSIGASTFSPLYSSHPFSQVARNLLISCSVYYTTKHTSTSSFSSHPAPISPPHCREEVGEKPRLCRYTLSESFGRIIRKLFCHTRREREMCMWRLNWNPRGGGVCKERNENVDWNMWGRSYGQNEGKEEFDHPAAWDLSVGVLEQAGVVVGG